jgi:homoserine dehydrogenase
MIPGDQLDALGGQHKETTINHATIAKRLAQQNISLESIVQRHRGERPHGGDVPGRSSEPVPVILITYATTEDAVRKALAAVDRDKVVLGKPQVIRIEKN